MDFLHYIERTDEQSAMESGSENIRKIHECVKRIKSNEEIGVKYMQTWEEKVIERQRGEAEGRLEGKWEDIMSILEELGEPSADLKELIYGQKDVEVLSHWLKLAYKSESLEKFEKKIQGKQS